MKLDHKLNHRPKSYKFIFRSLNYRNYRLYFGGQGISMIGTWMQQTAMGWLVYDLTNSALILGIVGFASQIPNLIIAPFAGVLIDRWNRYRTLIITQTLEMLQAIVLTILVFTGEISIWHIIPLGVFLGIVNCFDITVRQAFVFNIIERKEDLGNAIALSTSMMNLSRMLGPPIAGIMISVMGVGFCFFLNGISYFAVLAALFAIRVEQEQIKSKYSRILKDLREGFIYVFNSNAVRSIILLQGVICLAGWPAAVLMPVFAKEILRGGPETLGFLTGFSGTGAMVGVFYLALRRDARSMVRWIPLAAGILGIALVFFSQSRIPLFSMFLLLFTGFGVYVQMTAGTSVLMTIIDDDKRGRVLSIYNISFMGMVPIGNLMAGNLADKIGAPNTLMIGGFVCILGSLLFAGRYRQISVTIKYHLHKVNFHEKTLKLEK